jgi:hypothetical protein
VEKNLVKQEKKCNFYSNVNQKLYFSSFQWDSFFSLVGLNEMREMEVQF